MQIKERWRVPEKSRSMCLWTSNTIPAARGVTGKERAKTRLMQIFARSPGSRNLSVSHNFVVRGYRRHDDGFNRRVRTKIPLRYAMKKIFIPRFSFAFVEHNFIRRNTANDRQA